jgi:hypothetical protein
MRAARREDGPEIRVNPPERRNRHRISQHSPQHSVSAIFSWPQSVSMFDPAAPTSKRSFPRTDMVFHSDVLAKNLTTPAIVISGNHENGRTGLCQLRETGEHAKALSRNDRPPLEPELE